MATGLQMYEAVRAASREAIRGQHRTIVINDNDALDLVKLNTQELVACGYDECIADKVVSALPNLGLLQETLGVQLVISNDAPSLLT